MDDDRAFSTIPDQARGPRRVFYDSRPVEGRESIGESQRALEDSFPRQAGRGRCFGRDQRKKSSFFRLGAVEKMGKIKKTDQLNEGRTPGRVKRSQRIHLAS